jgi:hypothetical protein
LKNGWARARAVPSLTYLERQPDFSIGPEVHAEVLPQDKAKTGN